MQLESYELRYGKSNCSWASCREGCTAEIFKCHQVRVTYTPELSWQEDVSMEQIDQQEWAHLHRLDRKVSKHSHLVIPSLVTTVQPTELVPRQSQIKRAIIEMMTLIILIIPDMTLTRA